MYGNQTNYSTVFLVLIAILFGSGVVFYGYIDIQSSYHKVQAENAAYQNTVTAQQAEIGSLGGQIQATSERIAQLEAQLQALTQENKALMDHLVKVTAQSEQQQTDLKALTEALQANQELLRNAQISLMQLQENYDQAIEARDGAIEERDRMLAELENRMAAQQAVPAIPVQLHGLLPGLESSLPSFYLQAALMLLAMLLLTVTGLLYQRYNRLRATLEKVQVHEAAKK